MGIRIKGLVKAYNSIRKRLAEGISTADQEAFRREVGEVIAQVEQICRANWTRPSRLPGPSRNAYRFLKELALEDLPEPSSTGDSGPVPVKEIRVKNVVSLVDSLSRKMWVRLDELAESLEAREQLLLRIRNHGREIEAICHEHDGTPAQLGDPTRRAYCWLKFLSDQCNLDRHLSALSLALEASLECRLEPPAEVHLTGMASLWRTKHQGGGLLVKCSEGYVDAPASFWHGLFEAMKSRNRTASGMLLRAYAGAAEFESVVLEMDSFAASSEGQVKGNAHDLDDSFRRVNDTYFESKLSRPSISWSTVPTARTWGHYQFSRDRLTVSSTLDQSLVPAFVVDFIMYHELLHKVHGTVAAGTRRIAHTRSFRADERKFADYGKAEEFLKRLSRTR